MGWRLWQYSPKGKGYKIFHTSLIIILYKGKKGFFFGDAQPHEYWLQHTEVPEGHSSMTCIALLWDPLLLRIAKRDLPLLPISSSFRSFPVLHTPTSSHSYLIPSVSQFSSNTVRITVGLKWDTRKLSICAIPDSSRGHPSLCPGLTLRSDHWPTSSVCFSEPHHDSITEKKHSWSLKI